MNFNVTIKFLLYKITLSFTFYSFKITFLLSSHFQHPLVVSIKLIKTLRTQTRTHFKLDTYIYKNISSNNYHTFVSVAKKSLIFLLHLHPHLPLNQLQLTTPSTKPFLPPIPSLFTASSHSFTSAGTLPLLPQDAIASSPNL